MNGLVDNEPVKISIYVIDVVYKDLRWWARHHTPRMATLTVDHLNDIESSHEGQPGPLPPGEILTSLTIQTVYGTTNEFSIYSWDERVEKSHCFEFGDFGTEVEIIPCFEVTSV
jgi:hypothetical protein